MSKDNRKNTQDSPGYDAEFHSTQRKKMELIWADSQPYPNSFRRSDWAEELQRRHGESSAEQLRAESDRASVAGRVMASRKMGRVMFLDLRDMSGKIQLFIKQNIITPEQYEKIGLVDVGDIVGAAGSVFRTRTGELSIEVDEFHLLNKTLRPLPEKFHGLKNREQRYRRRYLDLVMNEEVRDVFRMRTRIIQFIREFMTERQFLEVETPMMHLIPGGAVARPFTTHHNALSLDMYLRIAPELFLKRLVVGGFERVFEINRNFRNEGVSTQHNPEFTMLEFYQAFADFKDFIALTEEMFEDLATSVIGTNNIEYQGKALNIQPPFRKLSLVDAVLEHNPELSRVDLRDFDRMAQYLTEMSVNVKPEWKAGKLLFEIFEKTVEANLWDPTFIIGYPVEVSPLSRVSDDDPSVADRFEFFAGGMEIANGFSELNDSVDQAQRFKDQVAQKDAGDLEAMHYDDDYIQALEYGLPPTAGEGIGIDRLVMLLTDSASIRDVVLFPHMRPTD